MDTKLTLKLDKEVIERAKRFAKRYNTSLSKLVEHYFEQITRQEQEDKEPEFSHLVSRLYGIAPIPPDYDPETDYFEFLIEKHNPQNAG